jgi:hypothetical protein
MRITRVFVVALALAAVLAPAAAALAFEDWPGYHPPDAIQGASYSFQFKAHAGCPPYKYSIYRGSLPPGLTLGSSGQITGAATTPGYYPFTVQLEDQCGTQPSQRDFSINISPKLTVLTDDIGHGIVGNPYSIKFSASGGGNQSWALYSGSGPLPPGLSFAADGTLSGTPTTAGSYSFVVQVSDASRSDTHQVSLEVVDKLAATPVTTKEYEVGTPLSIKLAATGGKAPLAWSQAGGTLPAGLTLNGDTITGTPTAPGSTHNLLTLSDAFGQTAVVDVPLTIRAAVAIKTAKLPATKVGKLYRAVLRTNGGVQPFGWKVTSGKFPVGIRLNRTTGVLSGSARQAGSFTLEFTVRDSYGQTQAASLTLTVAPVKKKK